MVKMMTSMYFTLVFQVIVCKDIGSVDLRQILTFNPTVSLTFSEETETTPVSFKLF